MASAVDLNEVVPAALVHGGDLRRYRIRDTHTKPPRTRHASHGTFLGPMPAPVVRSYKFWRPEGRLFRLNRFSEAAIANSRDHPLDCTPALD